MLQQKNKPPRILLYDIETSPLISYTWGLWEQNVIEVKEDWHFLSFAFKWLGDKKTQVLSLPDFPLYKKDKQNDKSLVERLHSLFSEADIVVAHNGSSFDQKKSNARFIFHGLTPPEPYKEIDTKLVAKRYFKFDSNSLNSLGKYLNLGEKLETGGFDLWLGCMGGDKKSWKKMCEYNKQDVELLEKVYLTLRPWMTNSPNIGLLQGSPRSCPNCGSSKVHKRGFGINAKTKYERLHCQSCGSWRKGDIIKLDKSV